MVVESARNVKGRGLELPPVRPGAWCRQAPDPMRRLDDRQEGSMDVTTVLVQLVSGAVGGAVLLAIVGAIKGAMGKKS